MTRSVRDVNEHLHKAIVAGVHQHPRADTGETAPNIGALDVIEHAARIGMLSRGDKSAAITQLVERQAQALNAVRKLHGPVYRCWRCDGQQPCWPGPCDEKPMCRTTCGPMNAHPCHTIRAIDQAGA